MLHPLSPLAAPNPAYNPTERSAGNPPDLTGSPQSASTRLAFLNQLRTSPSAHSDLAMASPQDPATGDRSPMKLPAGTLAPLQTLPPQPLPWASHQKPVIWNDSQPAIDRLNGSPQTVDQAMQQFVGETFFGLLMKQLRDTVIQSDLFGNDSAHNLFQSQLDQTLVQELAAHAGAAFSQPFTEQLNRARPG